MAKSSRAGYSKARLCPPLKPQQAARLSAAFLRDTTETVRAAAASRIDRRLCRLCARRHRGGADTASRARHVPDPGGRLRVCASRRGGVWPLPPACGPGVVDRGHAAVCVLSADTPTLPTAILVKAATLLLTDSEPRVVIGACDDGGYYLLGIQRPNAGLFADIAWSTDAVAAQMRVRAVALGLDRFELPLWYDVDDDASLDRLVQETSGSNAAPRTRHAIGALGLQVPLPSAGAV